MFAHVRLDSSFVPARITGYIEEVQISEGVEFAVVVNGQIAALTRVFRLDGRQRFSALVPETAFREGRNRVALFSIESETDLPPLTLLGSTDRRHGAQPRRP